MKNNPTTKTPRSAAIIYVLWFVLSGTQVFAQSAAPPTPVESNVISLRDLPLPERFTSPLDYRDEAVLDKQGRCKLHHLPLQETKIPIAYGLRPAPLRSLKEAEAKSFPNAKVTIEGGCIVLNRQALVLHCPRCKSEREHWQQKHPR